MKHEDTPHGVPLTCSDPNCQSRLHYYDDSLKFLESIERQLKEEDNDKDQDS